MNKRTSPISVLMAYYRNDDPYRLSAVLQSIVIQLDAMDQLVLVRDGPTPKKLDDVIQKIIGNFELTWVKLEKNHGLGPALNMGLYV